MDDFNAIIDEYRICLFEQVKKNAVENFISDGHRGELSWDQVERNIRCINTLDLESLLTISLGRASILATNSCEAPSLTSDMVPIVWDAMINMVEGSANWNKLIPQHRDFITSKCLKTYYGMNHGNSRTVRT